VSGHTIPRVEPRSSRLRKPSSSMRASSPAFVNSRPAGSTARLPCPAADAVEAAKPGEKSCPTEERL
jgi:hypothetical protein